MKINQKNNKVYLKVLTVIILVTILVLWIVFRLKYHDRNIVMLPEVANIPEAEVMFKKQGAPVTQETVLSDDFFTWLGPYRYPPMKVSLKASEMIDISVIKKEDIRFCTLGTTIAGQAMGPQCSSLNEDHEIQVSEQSRIIEVYRKDGADIWGCEMQEYEGSMISTCSSVNLLLRIETADMQGKDLPVVYLQQNVSNKFQKDFIMEIE